MRPTLLTATAASVLLLCQAGAMAQTKTPTTQSGAAPTINETQSTMPNASTHGSLRAQMRDMLQKEGFTDVRVVPSSFMVRAKDKDGNPVVMSISPDSFTEVSEVGSPGSDNGTMDSRSNTSGSRFVSIANSDELSSNVVGLDVYNNDNKSIGQIKDIAMN